MKQSSQGVQKQIFLDKEGDAWYKRNKQRFDKDFLSSYFDSLSPYLNKDSKVLEIGCSSGENLFQISSRFDCEAYGLDPSSAAINEGKKKFSKNSKIHLSVGAADNFSFDFQFDMIFFGFCLYLCDREHLPKIVYNCDYHLKNSGYLGIVDFDPPVPVKNKYTHTEGVYSYKMNYSNLFLSYPSYELVLKNSMSHEKKQFHESENERVGSWLMYKNVDKGYYHLEG